MNLITVSAPGKIHLSGEHAVVYGRPAVLAAVSRRIFITVSSVKRPFDSPSASSGFTQGKQALRHENKLNKLRKKDKFLNEIVRIVEEKYQTKIQDVILDIKSDIPVGAGMGSSAAFAAATIGALIQYLRKPWDVTAINELAFKAEKFQHGNPSGGDNTVVTYGGWLWYRKELTFLKLFHSLNIQLPQMVKFMLIQTGRQESTGEMVKYVARLMSKNQSKYGGLINQIEQTTKDLMQSIYDQNIVKIKQEITNNQRLLEKLGVVSKSTQRLVREIENSGGAAKISGAGGIRGGSGIVICCHNQPEVIENLAKRHNYQHFQVKLGEPGVKVENKPLFVIPAKAGIYTLS